MTRKEAKEFLTTIYYVLGNMSVECLTEKDGEKIREAIKALEQEPCEDCISRQAAIRACCGMSRFTGIDEAPYEYVEDVLRKLPSVAPQPKTGHWIRWYEQKETELYIENIPHCKCSECGKEYDPHSSQFIKYCSECGAKMIEPQESEE